MRLFPPFFLNTQLNHTMKKLLFLFIILEVSISVHAQKEQTVLPKQIQDSLVFELAQIYGLDQGIRNVYMQAKDDEQRKMLGKTMILIDSVNFQRMISLIKKFGYPNRKLLGENYSQECVGASSIVVMLHNPRRLIKGEVYNLLKREVEKENLSAKNLAMFLDKYYTAFERRSLYNTQFKSSSKAKGVLFEDKQLSDSLMLDIGLQPLPDSVFVRRVELER